MSRIDTTDIDALSGAVFFSVGRGTEGGSASYRLSVAGVTTTQWGQVAQVAANSGYSMGTIQVDFGQRGTWPVGAIADREVRAGERTYVDAVIEQASSYAKKSHLPFAENLKELRADLLTHGNGQRGRQSITFIDSGTRDSINAWASSPEGQRWVHANIDYPQIRNATQYAKSVVDQYASNIPEDKRFQAISLFAKTANQAPGLLDRLEKVLKDGGDYDDLLAKAKAIKANPRFSYYDGPKAADVAERYAAAYNDPIKAQALDRANAMVSRPNFDPAAGENSADIHAALAAIGQRTKQRGHATANATMEGIQRNLNELGITDARGLPLVVDGKRGGPGSHTNEAISAFKYKFGLEDHPMTDAGLLAATQVALTADPLRNFDRAMRNVLPEPAEARPIASSPHNGLPDYLVVNHHSAQREEERHSASHDASGRSVRAHPDVLASSHPPRTMDTSEARSAPLPAHTSELPAPDDLVGQYLARHGSGHRMDASPDASAVVASTVMTPEHPNFSMLQQIRTGVRAEAERQGWDGDRAMAERVSHNLLAECVATGGLKRVDHVVVGPTGNIFAVEGKLDDPARKWACVSLDAASRTPVEQSEAKLAATHEAAHRQSQEAAMAAPEARSPTSPTLTR
jgi:hypothetical protein